MRLADLAGIGGDSRVTGFAIDHRKVAPGTVFGAFRGTRLQRRGLHPGGGQRGRGGGGRPARGARSRAPPMSPADEPRREFARLAAKFFEPFPETMVAVTGTNGKTSSVELTRQLWRMAGHHAASIGTLGVTTADDRTDDRPDHARHRHLPVEHGGPCARRRDPCRVRGVEPRPVAISHRGAAGAAPRPSPTSPATISIITRRWRPISRPRCGCSTRSSSRAARR